MNAAKLTPRGQSFIARHPSQPIEALAFACAIEEQGVYAHSPSEANWYGMGGSDVEIDELFKSTPVWIISEKRFVNGDPSWGAEEYNVDIIKELSELDYLEVCEWIDDNAGDFLVCL